MIVYNPHHSTWKPICHHSRFPADPRVGHGAQVPFVLSSFLKAGAATNSFLQVDTCGCAASGVRGWNMWVQLGRSSC